MVDVCSVIKRRLEELGLEQKDLAAAAEVTDSYVSQLLARKKLPPAPDRTSTRAELTRISNRGRQRSGTDRANARYGR